MSAQPPKRNMRMAGAQLQLAARLIETPGPGSLLYRMATKQLGLDYLRETRVPPATPPYRATHLGSVEGRGA